MPIEIARRHLCPFGYGCYGTTRDAVFADDLNSSLSDAFYERRIYLFYHTSLMNEYSFANMKTFYEKANGTRRIVHLLTKRSSKWLNETVTVVPFREKWINLFGDA